MAASRREIFCVLRFILAESLNLNSLSLHVSGLRPCARAFSGSAPRLASVKGDLGLRPRAISARGHTPQASNHSAMRLLIWRDALTPSVARRCDTAKYRVQRSTSRSTPLAIIPLRGGRAA